jgi:hypothetical protein
VRRGAAPCLTLVIAAALWIGLSEPALAYVGPGAGLGAIGAFLGLVATVLLTVGVLVLWPVRRLLRRVRNKPAAETPDPGAAVLRSGGPPPDGPATPEDPAARR